MPLPLRDPPELEAAIYAMDVASGLAAGGRQFRSGDVARLLRERAQRRYVDLKYAGHPEGAEEERRWPSR